MATQNGLTRRLERLEGITTWTAAEQDVAGERRIAKLAWLAGRLQWTLAPPIGRQSPAERCVRACFTAAEGYEGAEYRRRFCRP